MKSVYGIKNDIRLLTCNNLLYKSVSSSEEGGVHNTLRKLLQRNGVMCTRNFENLGDS